MYEFKDQRILITGAASGIGRLMAQRVHGAMMLSYLRDPRAEELMASLRPLTPPQQRVRDRVLATYTPLSVCNPQPVEEQLEVCVFNGTAQLHRAMVVRELGEGGKTHMLRDLFLPGRGMRFTLPIDESGRAERAVAHERPPGHRQRGRGFVGDHPRKVPLRVVSGSLAGEAPCGQVAQPWGASPSPRATGKK